MSAYRQSPFANITPVVKNLLIINIICFIALLLYDKGDQFHPGAITTLFGLHYFFSPHFRVWQIITYMFMHGGFAHIFFNMFALFMFGSILESALGSKRFLNLYFICGIGAALLQIGVQAVEIHNITGGFTIPMSGQVNSQGIDFSYFQYGGPDAAGKLYVAYDIPTVGASGAIFGVLVAFAMLYPNLELLLFFIPIPIKAKYLVPAYIVFEIWAGLGQNAGDNVAHFAHIGGALFGFLMVKIWGVKRMDNFY